MTNILILPKKGVEDSNFARPRCFLIYNQIDFLQPPSSSSINKAKTKGYPGTNIDGNYNLLLTNRKLTLDVKHSTVNSRTHFELAEAVSSKKGGYFYPGINFILEYFAQECCGRSSLQEAAPVCSRVCPLVEASVISFFRQFVESIYIIC